MTDAQNEMVIWDVIGIVITQMFYIIHKLNFMFIHEHHRH